MPTPELVPVNPDFDGMHLTSPHIISFATVWTLLLTEEMNVGDAKADLVTEFLHRHGLKDTPIGSRLRVQDDSAGLMLYAAQFARDDNGHVRLCPHCTYCIRQELYRVPLSGPVPDVPEAEISPELAEKYRRELFGEETRDADSVR